MHLPHFLDFIKIDNKAPLICMVLLDTLPTENRQMIRAVKMLDPLIMLLTEQGLRLEVLIFKIDISQDVISLHDLIEDIEVQWQLIDTLNLLDKLPANWAAHSEVMVQHR